MRRRLLLTLPAALALAAPASAGERRGTDARAEIHAAQQREQQMIKEQQRLERQQQEAARKEMQAFQRQQQEAARKEMHAQQQQQKAAGQEQQRAAERRKATARTTAVTPHRGVEHMAVARTVTHHAYRSHRLMGWPQNSSASSRHLLQLERDLRSVGMTGSPGSHHALAIRNDLARVSEYPGANASGRYQGLSNDLVTALSARQSAGVDTRELALHLRALVNGNQLGPEHFGQALAGNRAILERAKVRPPHVRSVQDDLAALAGGNQTATP